MSHEFCFSLTQEQYDHLTEHLLPTSNKQNVAFVFCGQSNGKSKFKFLAKHIAFVHHDDTAVTNPRLTEWLDHPLSELLAKANEEQLAVVKVCSHPDGPSHFTTADDKIDFDLLPLLAGFKGTISPSASVILLPDGQMFGRVMYALQKYTPMSSINIVGDNLSFWYDKPQTTKADFTASHGQIFGEGTTERLQKLSIAIVGCSGTGSPLAEQLARLGVKKLTLVDDDVIEERNLNRIYGSRMEHATNSEKKVDVIKKHIQSIGLGTNVTAVPHNLWNAESIRAVAECDIVFGCVDTIDGRFLLNKLCTYYLLPYFDIGIRLDASPEDGLIREVCGTIHYLQPKKSSLLSRGLFSLEDVANAGLKRLDPDAYQLELEEGYIRGVQEDRPAVINVNTLGASLAVNEMLSRIHPYREEPNKRFAQVIFSLASMEFITESEDIPCTLFANSAGTGDTSPLLDMPELSVKEVA
ncbi:ThiF family adenylyltransferase [Halodesulfovibrio sp.]|uniref:ThiF family adenylyltransferase n=1 Tax=Halodesulfovibrio sp. TaxID=1912772 RepID=UPI0025BA8D5A|nr:ThiF family adenylyltransferase [Halodesulfovibrio sp.]